MVLTKHELKLITVRRSLQDFDVLLEALKWKGVITVSDHVPLDRKGRPRPPAPSAPEPEPAPQPPPKGRLRTFFGL